MEGVPPLAVPKEAKKSGGSSLNVFHFCQKSGQSLNKKKIRNGKKQKYPCTRFGAICQQGISTPVKIEHLSAPHNTWST